jgi:hypothetical protein
MVNSLPIGEHRLLNQRLLRGWHLEFQDQLSALGLAWRKQCNFRLAIVPAFCHWNGEKRSCAGMSMACWSTRRRTRSGTILCISFSTAKPCPIGLECPRTPTFPRRSASTTCALGKVLRPHGKVRIARRCRRQGGADGGFQHVDLDQVAHPIARGLNGIRALVCCQRYRAGCDHHLVG